jgi:hypothetical protein
MYWQREVVLEVGVVYALYSDDSNSIFGVDHTAAASVLINMDFIL